MTDKQLINSTETCVKECLYGFSQLQPHLVIDYNANVVFDPDQQNVAIVSGGGSGHEPFPAGYVGSGMLTASVSGDIFTSPPFMSILQAIHLTSAKSSGVLLIVPNYTGDVLNFGLAGETAISEGITVETVVVGEDVSQEIRGVSKAGKRGMCGLVLVFKITGYLSSKGCDLQTIKNTAECVVRSMASMGLCVSACSKPGFGPLFHLSGDEVEIGVGVHGEAGIARVKLMSGTAAVQLLLERIIPSLELSDGDEVVALVNNLGALSCVEEWLLSGEVARQLSDKNVKLLRLYCGRFFTSLNMAGVQICILKLGKEKNIILEGLDFPTTAPAWKNKLWKSSTISVPPCHVRKHFNSPTTKSSLIKDCFTKIADNLTREETKLNQLDSACGDGDCGSTFNRLGRLLKDTDLDYTNPAKLFFDLSLIVGESIGGTTGALYGLFFKGVSQELEKLCSLPSCWRRGVESIKKYSKARLGDRTMLDALETGCETFEREWDAGAKTAFSRALKAAMEGCEKTKFMTAFAGRASYTSESEQRNVDAGAYAVVVWLSAIQEVLEEH